MKGGTLMAVKKRSLEVDLTNADFMTIMSGGGKAKVFSSNSLIDFSYPTGVSVIDYATAYELNVFDMNTKQLLKKRIIKGIQAGTFNVISGRTQSFKTTITSQLCSNIAYSSGGNIVHYDTEGRLVGQRIKTLSKLPLDWFEGEHPRYVIKGGSIGFDTLQADIAEIYENKMRNEELLLKDTGEVDGSNRPIKLMPPTIVFIDSLQNVTEKEYNIDDDNIAELRSKTQGARSAYTIRGFITDILPMCKEANIIVMCIAHKTTNMSLQAYGGPKKQFQYGSNDERISGGSAVEFNAALVMNLTGISRDDSRFHIETDGFEGNTILFEPTKCSTNESGNEKSGLGFEIIVDKRHEGVDNIRTLIRLLVNKGRLKGNKAGYRVINSEGEVVGEKFTWKTVHEDFAKDHTTLALFYKAAKEELEKYISRAPEKISGSIKPFDIDAMLEEAC